MAKQTPTKKVWKNISEQYPEYFSGDYIWRKDLADYTATEVKNLDEAKISLAYEHGIAFLEYIDVKIKSQQTRISLLLGYLLFLVTGLISYVFSDGALYGTFEWLAFSLAMAYTALMVLLFQLLTGYNIASIYGTPKEFLHKSKAKYDVKLLELEACKTFQLSAEKNLEILRQIAIRVKWYIRTFVAISAIAIAVAVYNSL